MKAGTRDILIRSSLVGVFLLTGAGIFHVLESPTDHGHDTNEDIDEATLEKLRTNLSVNMTKKEFDELVNKLHEFYQDHHERASSYDWTYYASLYFSASVITTIGRYLPVTYIFNYKMVSLSQFINRQCNCTKLKIRVIISTYSDNLRLC